MKKEIIMKNKILIENKLAIFLLLLFGLIFSLSSCDDIINSDDNINRTKIEYDYVLSDQEISVILPLKAGNKWLYIATEYDGRGEVENQYYDSIVVEKDTLIHNEKWFYVRGWCGNYSDRILLTNTDVGLWLKCEPCGDSFLEAKYPKGRNPYFSGEISSFVLDTDSLVTDTVLRWTRYEDVARLEVPNGTYDCIKFTDRIKYKITGEEIDPRQSLYCVPDMGLIRWEKFSPDNNQNIIRTYELISHNLDGEHPAAFRQNILEFVLDSVGIREPIAYNIENVLTNISRQNASILSISIGETNMNMTILNGSFPIEIAPGASFSLSFGVSGRQQGKYFGTIIIITDSGKFEIEVSG